MDSSSWHANGHRVWVRENIRPLSESDQLLIVGEDITETKQLSEKLEYQARYDLLTGTYNRNFANIDVHVVIQVFRFSYK